MKKWVCLPIYTCTHHDLPLLRAGYNRSDNNTQCGEGGGVYGRTCMLAVIADWIVEYSNLSH